MKIFNFEKGICLEAVVELSFIQNWTDFFIEFKITNPEKLEILLLDINQFNGMVYNKGSFMGDNSLERIESKRQLFYDIELSATQLDPHEECEDYGSDHKFTSYRECFEDKVNEELSFLGCTFPWFTDDMSAICTLDTPNIHQIFQIRVFNE